jgi:uncharacterized protein (DUF608 family)
LATFWQSLHYDGKLDNQISHNPESHSAAVCCSLRVPAQETRSVLYVLSWYFPRFEVEGRDQSNGYARHFKNSVEVATHTLKRSQYLFGAVDAWHQRLLSASLPRWFSRMLINSNYVLSTNTLLTRDGQFAMMESPGVPMTGSLDRRLHTSLGTLLFFPELEGQEFARFAGTVLPEAPGRLCRHLGRGCAHQPEFGPESEDLVDLGPKFVLMAYRNYHMTGNRPMIAALYPRLKQVMAHCLSLDADGNGLPDHTGVSTTFDGWGMFGANSYTSSLWVAALRAHASIAEELDDAEEAAQYRAVEAKAVASFEGELWNDAAGYYSTYQDASRNGGVSLLGEACHTGQLAGEWYADFLCLGRLFDQGRVERAAGAMYRLNDREFGAARATLPDGSSPMNPPSAPSDPRADLAWPTIDATHYACLLMAHGRGNEALRAVEKIYTNIHVKGGRTFNQPLYWDPAKNQTCGVEMDRHVGASSLWHVLYALQGFLLDAGEHTLWVRPNLPGGVHYLSVPVFTPVCFGWLSFQEGEANGYRQVVKIKFDESVLLHKIMLRAPQSAMPLNVSLTTPEGPHSVQHSVRADGGSLSVEIVLENPLVLCQGMQITLQQTAG